MGGPPDGSKREESGERIRHEHRFAKGRAPTRREGRIEQTRRKRPVWYLTGSAIVSCVVLGYLLTVVKPGEIVRAIRNAALAGVAAYMVGALATTVLRNARYLLLVRASGADIPISGGEMFLVTLVRNLFSDLLPARIGTLVYIYILRARFGFPVEIGASTYAVAFILDLAVMVPLMAVGVAVVGEETLGIPAGVLWGVASIFFAAAAVALVYLAPLLSLAGKAASRLSQGRLVADMADFCERTSSSVRRIYRAGVFWKVAFLSIAIRMLKYGCIAFLIFAVLHPIDPEKYTLRTIGYWPVFVGASLAELSASTPVSGIGGFGAYEGVWTGVFHLLGYPKRLAALSGISAHIITQVFGYSLGAAAIIALMAPLLRRRRRAAPPRRG